MSLGCICYILLPNKLLCVASAQFAAFGTGEDGQDAPVDAPAQSVHLQVVEQLRHDLRKGWQSQSPPWRRGAHTQFSTDQIFPARATVGTLITQLSVSTFYSKVADMTLVTY